MFATTLVIMTVLESAHIHERHRDTVTAIATRVINQYENGEPVRGPNFSVFRDSGKGPGKSKHFQFTLKIYDDDELIFNIGRKVSPKVKLSSFMLESDSGKTYKIVTHTPRAPRALLGAFKRLSIVHLLLILPGSALVSFLLSWSITKPLKKIGRFSRNYASGGGAISIDPALLARGDELGDLARDFDYMTREVEKNIESKKQLLHNVSHELRAPLARLQAAAALLEQSDSALLAHTNIINKECKSIDDLIQEILDYSRQDYDKFEEEKIDLLPLLDNVLNDIRLEFPEREIIYAPRKIDHHIKGNLNLSARAIENILRNACRHTPTNTTIELSLREAQENVLVEIFDEGPGIPEAELANIFTPFYRSAKTKSSSGYGLGFCIAKKAMENQQGYLAVENSKEGGLQVTLGFKMWRRS